uniref:Uncharacterized protein n=1 Tax=Ananas comosus var. bracteatus TaxID=296719 RepID=A0A6V7QP45_ANACO|nr:unnamed protein product [Ananas comosus var. bracteatus]
MSPPLDTSPGGAPRTAPRRKEATESPPPETLPGETRCFSRRPGKEAALPSLPPILPTPLKLAPKLSSQVRRQHFGQKDLPLPPESSAPSAPSGSASSNPFEALAPCLENRYQKLKKGALPGNISNTCFSDPTAVGCSSSKKVLWADSVGQALTRTTFFYLNKPSSAFTPPNCQPTAKPSTPEGARAPFSRKSYRDALLTPATSLPPPSPPPG